MANKIALRHVVVYIFKNKDGSEVCIPLTYPIEGSVEAIAMGDVEIENKYGDWARRLVFPNQTLTIIEGGLFDGSYDLSRFEK